MKALFFTASCLAAIPAFADNSCSFSMQHDLEINPQYVILQQEKQELWRIDPTGQFWLDGKAVNPNRANRKLLQEYQQSVRQQTQQTVELVADALELAGTALDQVLTELTGLSLEQHPGVQQAMQQVRSSTEQIIIKDGSTLQIRGDKLSTLEQAFDKRFEEAVEQAITQSIGNILILAGKAMLGSEGSIEQRMETFSNRMEHFGEELGSRMEARAEVLEQRGEQLCEQFKKLEQLENRLQQHYPSMQKLITPDASHRI